jgi:hypothetical protein
MCLKSAVDQECVPLKDLLQVGFSGWITADGNYREFSVGDVRSFALEYYPEDEMRPAAATPSYRHLGDARHEVSGRLFHLGGLVQHLTPTWCVIDVGVLAYRELRSLTPPPESFSGTVYLGVDPFFYFESLALEPDAPALIYNWRIHRIEVETAPRVFSDGMMIYDPQKLKLVDVQDTTRGEDFILHCERLPGLPEKQLIHV